MITLETLMKPIIAGGLGMEMRIKSENAYRRIGKCVGFFSVGRRELRAMPQQLSVQRFRFSENGERLLKRAASRSALVRPFERRRAVTTFAPAYPIMLAAMTDCLAVAAENAVIEGGGTLEAFFEKITRSVLADSFSNQEPFAAAGRAGEELVAKIG